MNFIRAVSVIQPILDIQCLRRSPAPETSLYRSQGDGDTGEDRGRTTGRRRRNTLRKTRSISPPPRALELAFVPNTSPIVLDLGLCTQPPTRSGTPTSTVRPLATTSGRSSTIVTLEPEPPITEDDDDDDALVHLLSSPSRPPTRPTAQHAVSAESITAYPMRPPGLTSNVPNHEEVARPQTTGDLDAVRVEVGVADHGGSRCPYCTGRARLAARTRIPQ